MSVFPGQCYLPCSNTFTKQSSIDNVSRANHVQQLAADISHIQSQIQQEIEDGCIKDKKAIKALSEIAKKVGYQTLEEYETAASSCSCPKSERILIR